MTQRPCYDMPVGILSLFYLVFASLRVSRGCSQGPGKVEASENLSQILKHDRISAFFQSRPKSISENLALVESKPKPSNKIWLQPNDSAKF